MAGPQMDNPMRRMLAHLAMPRTLVGLAERMHVDPDVGLVDVGELLEDAHADGWVVNLGSGAPDDVVEAASKDDDAIGFGKGQAKIWQARAEAGRYDTDGDYYMLSRVGWEAMKGPADDEEDEES